MLYEVIQQKPLHINQKIENLEAEIFSNAPSTGCPEKTFDCLILCKLKMTVFTQSVLYFLNPSYSNLNFGVKQSKNGSKFAEQWLLKIKISEPVDDRRADFFENMYQFKAATLLLQSSLERKNFVNL